MLRNVKDISKADPPELPGNPPAPNSRSGPPPDIFSDSPMANFYNRFLETVQRWPDLIAVEMQRQSGDIERHTYAELRTMTESVGRWLNTTGLERASRCAILAGNGPRWFACYLGTIAAGMIAVPLDTAFDASQVAKLLDDSGSSLLFADARNADTAASAIGSRPI